MPFDYKKEYKELYQPKARPVIIDVPAMRFLAVQGKGDPNEENGEYKEALSILYTLSYTLKMSYKTDHIIDGFIQYVVPPLEGFWWQEDTQGVDFARKDDFHWIALIRLPDFISNDDVAWAKETAQKKKHIDCSRAEVLTMQEGLCVQMLHIGPYDTEPATTACMDAYIHEQGFTHDFSDTRMHHEIYLSDPRKTAPEKCKTVIRHPIKKIAV